jgi:D-3-phosphoglycerate dehydrogenase
VKVLVTEPLSDRGLALLREDFQVDVRPELAAENLKVVARAGIGLDNVDVEVCTRRGVLVVNAPQSNIVSAAEHTVGLLLAQARNIPQADRALKAGEWARERYQGVELAGKTLGVIGLGRVGAMVAQRALAFGMRVIAHDPYVARDRAREMGVELMPTLEALLVQSDFVSIHLPRTPETEGLIGERELSLLKDGARIVNTARGGILDEDALVKALKDGRVAGAALDVFAEEPTTQSALFEFDEVVVTPHLGASTVEAQDKAGTTIAEMVRLALRGEFVPYAVNVSAGAEVPEMVRPFLPLAERLGSILTGLAEEAVASVSFEYLGRIAEADTRVLTLAALKGCLAGVVHEPVSYVNAPVIARERGISVTETKSTVSSDYVNLITLRAGTDAGDVSVGGTLVGKRDGERIVRVYDFEIDLAPARHMTFLLYEDRPGVIGRVGTMLGEASVNVASAVVGRRAAGGLALMTLTTDGAVPPNVLERMVREIGADRARSIVVP